jgi:CubicO group peptidase (beta-lactamase class C family)
MESIDQAFLSAIEQKIFSGAQVIVGKGKDRLFSACYGRCGFRHGDGKITEDILFDVASLTKPVVTTTLAIRAVQAGKLALTDPLRKWLPDCVRKEEMQIRHLLAHNSGLPPWLPIYQETLGKNQSADEIRQVFLTEIAQVSAEARLGERRIYSDLNFILLGFILERAFEQSLDELFWEYLSKPLEMSRSTFNPLEQEFQAGQIVLSGVSSVRGKPLRGDVNDENAAALGGVAGHAGLFSTAHDLEKFIYYFWGHYTEAAWQQFVGAAVSPKLGWDTVSRPQSQAGSYFSDGSIGHLAFTGCSLWFDLQDKKYVILLTNRTLSAHPDRDFKAFRPMIHDLLLTQLQLAATK